MKLGSVSQLYLSPQLTPLEISTSYHSVIDRSVEGRTKFRNLWCGLVISLHPEVRHDWD